MDKRTGARPPSMASSTKASTPASKSRSSSPSNETSATRPQDTSSPRPREDVPWEHDKDNAVNWPMGQKIFHTAIPALIAFICTIASSIYTPAISSIMEEMRVSSTVAILPYSLYVLGLAFGPMIGSPCSEKFGRRAVYLVSIPIFALFTLGSGFSNDIASLCICRFFAGVFGSPGLSIGSATIADLWAPADRAIPMTAYITTPFLAPSLGPLMGGYAIMGTNDWAWTMWITLFFTAVTLLPMFIFMKETYTAKIKADRSHTPGTRRASLKESFTTAKLAKDFPAFCSKTLSRPLKMLIEPIAGLFALYVAFNFGTVYIFFAVFPEIFASAYGFNLGEQGLAFLGLGVGTLLASFTILTWTTRIYKPRVIAWKKDVAASHAASEKATGQPPAPPPEWRLLIAFPGSVFIPLGLFLFAWTARVSVHWIVPILGMMFVGWGVVLIFMSAVMFVMDCYGPMYGASAMAANTLLRYIFGAAFPLFSRQMYERLGVDWATSLLGFLSILFMLIPPLFWKFGPWLRERTRYGKS